MSLKIVGRIQVLALLAALLMGCAPTAYQPMGRTGGYSETQLDKNLFQVFFRSNRQTTLERTSDLNLLRAADLTLEKRFRYFVILESEKNYKYTGGGGHLIGRPRTVNTIRCFKDKPKADNVVFDAKFISKSIREKYGIR